MRLFFGLLMIVTAVLMAIKPDIALSTVALGLMVGGLVAIIPD